MRYRLIHCSIWNDQKFPFCSDDCQLVFLHLLTTPYSTPFGLFKIPLAALAEESAQTAKNAAEMIQRLSETTEERDRQEEQNSALRKQVDELTEGKARLELHYEEQVRQIAKLKQDRDNARAAQKRFDHSLPQMR